MTSESAHQEAMENLAIRLFAALLTYTMGSGSMDKTYREMMKKSGRVNKKLIELAEHSFRVFGELNNELWEGTFNKPDPSQN